MKSFNFGTYLIVTFKGERLPNSLTLISFVCDKQNTTKKEYTSCVQIKANKLKQLGARKTTPGFSFFFNHGMSGE